MFGSFAFGQPMFGQGSSFLVLVPPTPSFNQPLLMTHVRGAEERVLVRGRQGTGTIRGSSPKVSDVSGE
jgi:hypothetical protein